MAVGTVRSTTSARRGASTWRLLRSRRAAADPAGRPAAGPGHRAVDPATSPAPSPRASSSPAGRFRISESDDEPILERLVLGDSRAALRGGRGGSPPGGGALAGRWMGRDLRTAPLPCAYRRPASARWRRSWRRPPASRSRSFDKDELVELGCGGLLGVNAGSAEPPRMVQADLHARRQPPGAPRARRQGHHVRLGRHQPEAERRVHAR